MTIVSTGRKVHINIGTARIQNSKSEKLLGLNTDSKLK